MGEERAAQHWAGLGGGGLKVSYAILENLHRQGYISVFEEKRKKEEKPPTIQREKRKKKEERESFPPYIVSGSSRIVYYGMDADEEILNALKQGGLYREILQKHERYLRFVAGRLAGTGGVFERVEHILEEYKEYVPIVRDIKDIFSQRTGVWIPFFSLDGGAGHGFFREHVKLIENGEILQRTLEPPFIMPITIAPNKADANKDAKWPERGIYRKYAENVLIALDYIEGLMKGSHPIIDACIVLDNDFSGFNALCNKELYDYDYVIEKVEPVITNGNFSQWRTVGGYTMNDANDAIVNSVFPIFMMLLRAPQGTKFGKVGQMGFDHRDIKSSFSRKFVIPSHLSISHRYQVGDILRDYSLEGINEELAYLAYYTFLISCAPLYLDNIENVMIFIWYKDFDIAGVAEDIRREVAEVFGDTVEERNIEVHQVVGIRDPNATIKVWTFTGMDSMKEIMEKKLMLGGGGT